MSLNNITKTIVDAVKNINNHGTSAYDTTAEVRRIEGNTAWVHIAGGVDETPVNLTIAAKAGDTVQVRVGGGRAWITGNETAPPTDDGMAMIANNTAVGAGKTAKQALEEANNAMEEANALAASMAETVIRINSDIADLQDQVDGNITTWFYNYVPTTSNIPASEWISEGTEDVHLGDLFYNTTTGYAYRWMSDGTNYSWLRITDTDVTKALADAAAAQDTADSKRRVFYTTPTAPYDLGDLWVQGSSGDILRCAQAKAEGASYSVSDWVLASKYTDDTVANQAISNAAAAASAASAAQASATAASTAASSAQSSANQALADAAAASQAASVADGKAVAAGNAASAAQSSANAAASSAAAAQASANNANEYASRALGGLSTVQSVTETLNWITSHGTMTLTSDTVPDPSHVYFIVDPQGDYVVGGTHYSVVSEPSPSEMSSYYELSIDESLNNYIAVHLSVTSEGLWLIPDAGGNKVLIATGSGTTYTSAGTYIIGAGGTVLSSFRSDGTEIGRADQSHIEIDYHSLQLKDKEGNVYFHVSDLRDENGIAEVVEKFHGDGSTQLFFVGATPYSVVSVSVDGVTQTPETDYTHSTGAKGFRFLTAPDNLAEIVITYETKSTEAKAYTLGIRGSGQIGLMSTAAGYETVASGASSFAEGNGTIASGRASHAEGAKVTVNSVLYSTTAEGDYSHAEGLGTLAIGEAAHSEGELATSSGRCSHAEGRETTASGFASHAEGNKTSATGDGSHAQNIGTIASGHSQTVIGRYNVDDQAAALVIGNGITDSSRSNALTVSWMGDVNAAGSVAIGGDVTIGNKSLLDYIYPVGAIYLSTVSASPATLFGGTWERIQDQFLLAAGTTYSAGATGGSPDAVVPYHRHSVSAVNDGITGGSHSHKSSTTSEYFVTSDVSNAYNAGFTTGASGQSRRVNAPEASSSIFHHRANTNSTTHTHDLPSHNTDYAGTSGNTAGANMPPYLVVYVWKRTA